jgi:High-affinity Fe2+/Pb2+ permease
MLSFNNVIAKESYSGLYIKITDAATAVKNNRQGDAKKLFSEIKEEFKKVKNSDSVQGKKVQELLNKEKNTLTEDDLRQITAALLSFEKEQNPVNDEEEKKNFKSRMYPALDVLEKAIQSKNVEQMKKEYLKFNGVWTRNESFIRSRSVSYYGKVETAMSFLRSSMEVEPFDYENTMNSFNDLKSSIQDYLDGKKMENNVSGTVTLKEAVNMLKDALEAFKNGDKTKGQSKVKEFIQVWPTVEGDVSTRNSALYTKVETQTPIIMVKGTEKQYQDQLQGLITELSQIDTKAKYTFIDAMFILLREGVEALLIVLALVSSLKAANQKKGLRWVYAGAAAGILASVVIAFILQALFPAVSSGTNREILEGFVGIFAVVMMIGIGFWLHSKSSLKSWKNYIDRKMDVVLSTGSFISMFVLSFLAVFREGAETILFYVGILPLISLQNLITGVVSAILILIVIALVLIYASSKIKIHQVFFILTWTIYFLAFKMLGTSIHMLQVVGILPLHVIHFIPTVEVLGIYANIEVFISQLILIIIIMIATLKRKNN